MGVFGNGATGGVIGMGMVVSMHDAVSRNADVIKSKFQTLEGVTEVAANRITGAMNRIHAGLGLLAVGGTILASLAFPVRSAINFEDAFTGVRKTVTASEAEFAQLEKNLRGISKTAPISAVELSGIAESAGQLGVEGVDGITKFTDVIAKMSVTTNLTSESAATSFARIANVMQEPIKNVDRMGSTVVSLGNNFATTESEIADFANRMASAGKLAGLTTDQVFAISTAFSSVGISAEAGGTAVREILQDLVKDGKKGIGSFTDFVLDLQSQGDAAAVKLEELGFNSSRLQNAFLSVAGAGGILEESLANANKAWTQNTALTKEAELRYSTVASKLQIMRNTFTDLFISIGGVFLPVMTVFTVAMRTLANVLNFIASSPVGKFILGLVAGVGALITAFGLYLLIGGQVKLLTAKLAIRFAAMGKTAIAAAFANGGLTAGFYALATAVWTALAPLLPFLAAGAALVGVFLLLRKSVKMFGDVASGAAEPLTGFMGVLQKIGGILKGVSEIWRSATKDTFSFSKETHAALVKLGIDEFVVNLGTWIARIKAFFGGIASTFKTFFNIMGKVIKGTVNALNALGGAFGLPEIGKNTSNIELWIKAGKILGAVILFTLVPAMLSFAFSMLMASLPILLIIGLVVGVIAVFKNWGKITDWLGDKLSNVWTGIKAGAMSFFNFMFKLPGMFVNWGVGVVQSIWQGIKDGWNWLTGKLLGLIAKLPGGKLVLKLFGVDVGGDEPGGVGGGVVNDEPGFSLDQPTPLGATSGQIAARGGSSTERYENFTTNQSEVIKDINLIIDGKDVKTVVDKRDSLEDTRHD